MSVTFPRDMTSAHRWQIAALELGHRQEIARAADGRLQGKDLGPAIWRADYETVPMERAAADALMAEFETLGGLARTFYLHTARRARPLAFADVSTSGFATVAVSAIGAGRDTLALKNLPANFTITAGDFVSITTSAGIDLHRFAGTGTASASGVLAALPVVPHLRAGVAVDDVCRLIDPIAEMVLEPGTLALRQVNTLIARVSFRALQVLR